MCQTVGGEYTVYVWSFVHYRYNWTMICAWIYKESGESSHIPTSYEDSYTPPFPTNSHPSDWNCQIVWHQSGSQATRNACCHNSCILHTHATIYYTASQYVYYSITHTLRGSSTPIKFWIMPCQVNRWAEVTDSSSTIVVKREALRIQVRKILNIEERCRVTNCIGTKYKIVIHTCTFKSWPQQTLPVQPRSVCAHYFPLHMFTTDTNMVCYWCTP